MLNRRVINFPGYLRHLSLDISVNSASKKNRIVMEIDGLSELSMSRRLRFDIIRRLIRFDVTSTSIFCVEMVSWVACDSVELAARIRDLAR